MTPQERASAAFRAQWGTEPAGVVFAPGRVNLIGEHVDYNEGLVLPMPISRGTAVAWGAADDGAVHALAADLASAQDRFVPGTQSAPEQADWRCYLRGMAAEMAARGLPVGPARLAIAGDLPRGSGLSSSASLCIALGRAFIAAAGQPAADPTELALAGQGTEHRWAGVNCGIMDQMAVAKGQAGAALLLDCRDLSSRIVELPAGWAVMIVQSGVIRELADGHYNARRRECEEAAALLGVQSLRDAHRDAVDRLPAGLPQFRARHVVGEIARVEAAVEAIAAGDLAGLGDILRASHAALRDEFAVSHPQVDRLVAVLNDTLGTRGGARMTGGGFGGAVVAIMPADLASAARAAVDTAFSAPLGQESDIMIEIMGGPAAGGN